VTDSNHAITQSPNHPITKFLCLLCVLCGLNFAQAAAPVVTKVEPPNWWLGMPNPMLLLTGENLSSAAVSAGRSGVHVLRSEPGLNGKYLFVWLEIATQAQSGPAPLLVRTKQGSATAPFSLERRQPADGFRGLGEDDALYLIMPDRFADGDLSNDPPPQAPGTYDRTKARAYHGGDLRGIRDHLPYLKDLGVTALWLNPIYHNDDASPQDYHGYGAVDFYAVDAHFGTLREFQELVAAAHRLGIKIILDLVPNHTGPKHPWVANPPDERWLHGTPQHHLTARSPFPPLTDPHSVPAQWRDVVEGWFAGLLPDLNQENPRVAEYLFENAVWWAEEAGLDGFRLDTFPYVSRAFWSEWHRQLLNLYPRLTTVGEVWNADPTVTAFFVGGHAAFDGIDTRVSTVFDFPLMYALRDVVVRERSASRLVEVLQRDWLYPHPERLVTFIGNHDTVRFSSEPGGSKEKLKLAFSLLLTMRGIPQLYAGDEIGMPGGADPDNRRDFPGGFPGDARNAFTAAGRTADEQEIFAHIQSLLRLRREHPALRSGRHYHLLVDDTAYVFGREKDQDRLLVAFNNSAQPRHLRVKLADTPLAASSLRLLFAAAAGSGRISAEEAELELAPRSLAIYEVR